MGNNVKTLAINKPVLQHHKLAGIFFNFLDTPRIYGNDRTKVVRVMMNLRVNSDSVFKEIIITKLKYHTQVLCLHIFVHFSYILAELNLKN